MADRYWVGGTANWDATAGLKWSATSGGLGGEAVPTSSDNVFFDAASGTVTVTISIGAGDTCDNLDFTGFTGTITSNGAISIAGSLTLSSSMTLSGYIGTITFTATSSGKTITSNGKVLAASCTFNGVGGEWQPQDALSVGQFVLTSGTFNANNQDITMVTFSSTGAVTRVLTMGSGTWTVTGTIGAFTISGSGYTINEGTSTLAFTSTSGNAKTISVAGETLGNLTITGGGAGRIQFTSDGIFNNVIVGAPKSLRITASVTIAAADFDFQSSVGNVITIDSSSAGSRGLLSCPSGVIRADYLSLQDSRAVGGAVFYAGVHSINVSGNSGWIFEASNALMLGTV